MQSKVLIKTKGTLVIAREVLETTALKLVDEKLALQETILTHQPLKPTRKR